MRRLPAVLTAIMIAAPLGASAHPPDGLAAQVDCSGYAKPAGASGRHFPEPTESMAYVTFDQFACAMLALQDAYPDLLEVRSLGASEGQNDVYLVLMTDETVPAEGKGNLLISSSIHGDEIGGREGAVRQIEDMVDPGLLGEQDWVQQVMDEHVIHWLFPNPDGWRNGEGGGAYTRGNANGTDLNRNYPVAGYIAGNPLSESESQHTADHLIDVGNWYLGTDNHGQGGDTYAAAGLQIVGQFDYQKSETLARFADGIAAEMADANDVLNALDALNAATGQDMGPYHWGTLYDMLGYSASGSMIDWYNTPGILDGYGFATELTAGSGVNSDLHPTLLNQVHVDAIRAINATMFKQAIDPVEFTYEVGGTVAYVTDPRRITDTDGNGRGYDGARAGSYDEVGYDVSRMQFFEDLNRYADRPLASVRVPGVLAGDIDLSGFDTIILANDAAPEAAAEVAPDAPRLSSDDAGVQAWFTALRAWVEKGGNLVLTDAALTALPAFVDGIAEADVIMESHYVGSVEEFTDRNHPLNAGLRGVASQTYDTVPLGLAFPSAGEFSPNWKVSQTAWEAAGGFTAGTNGATNTIYGEVAVGDGRVRILGAVLPDPTEEFFHPFGLQNYAVTYTGYTLLQNMMRWDNPARVDSDVLAEGDDAPDAPASAPDPISTPATGGGAAAAATALLAMAARLGRRRN